MRLSGDLFGRLVVIAVVLCAVASIALEHPASSAADHDHSAVRTATPSPYGGSSRLPPPEAAAPAAFGAAVSGVIVALDTTSLPPRAFVHIDSALVPVYSTDPLLMPQAIPVYLSNPALLPGLGPGVRVTFAGDLLAPVGLSAGSVTIHPSDVVGARVATLDDDFRDPADEDDDGDYGGYGDYGAATATPTPRRSRPPNVAVACGTDAALKLEPRRGTAAVGGSYAVQVAVEGDGCGGYEVRVAFTRDSLNRRATVTPDPIMLNAKHQATFNYNSPAAGSDRFEVWLDVDKDGVRDQNEPWQSGSVTWTATAPTRTATATRTPNPTRTPSASRTPIPTRTPERPRGRS